MKREIYKVNEVSLILKQKYDTSEYPTIKNSKDCVTILYNSWDRNTIALEEQTKVIYLNKKNQIIGLYNAGVGGVDGTIMCNRKIFACGLKLIASSIIIAHNHPSGAMKVSEQDKHVTQNVKKAGDIMNIKLLDHIIIMPNGNYVSLADENLI